jgi:hypothetical protein
VAELAALTFDEDWLVSMRALDLLEKIAHQAPELVQPHKKLFLGPMAESEKWEVRLQIVRALPLLRWTAAERKRAVEILRRNVASLPPKGGSHKALLSKSGSHKVALPKGGSHKVALPKGGSHKNPMQIFVRAWALDSLATFAEGDAVLMRFVKRRLSEFERSDSKALQARAREIRARLRSRQVG